MKRVVLMLTLSLACSAAADEATTPVLVAAVDVPAGAVVTLKMVSQRAVPARLVTSSIVKPDSATYVINQKTTRPLLTGDVVTWSHFVAPAPRAVERCEQKLSKDAAPSALEQVRRARAAVFKR